MEKKRGPQIEPSQGTATFEGKTEWEDPAKLIDGEGAAGGDQKETVSLKPNEESALGTRACSPGSARLRRKLETAPAFATWKLLVTLVRSISGKSCMKIPLEWDGEERKRGSGPSGNGGLALELQL